jgi:hypothetical protein
MATACGTTQDMEKERTLVGAVLSLFLLQNHYTEGGRDSQEGQKKTCRKKQHVKVERGR